MFTDLVELHELLRVHFLVLLQGHELNLLWR